MSGISTEVVSPPLLCGEGPHWQVDEKVLYSVDLTGQCVRRYDPATKTETFIKLGDRQVTFVLPIKGQRNKFLISIGLTLYILTWDGKSSTPSNLEEITSVEKDKKKNRFNDAKADPSGRLWAGTMGYEISQGVFKGKQGSLYSMDKFRNIIKHVSDISISNGLAWSPDRKIFYFIDTDELKIEAFDFDDNAGKISNRRTMFDFKENNIEGFPDGMTIDAEGKLWVACYGGQQIIRVDPDTHKVMQTVKIPAPHVTSAAFGGTNLEDLYVTTASERLNPQQKLDFPDAGCTFKITGLGFKGLPPDEIILRGLPSAGHVASLRESREKTLALLSTIMDDDDEFLDDDTLPTHIPNPF
uniref:Regucalcin n=1 Tax=Timema bartmani TaxID=61472 RepID=A0A7R9EVK6_9NEOP|nr:unnamed protein product [Timema bartmani]